MYTYSAYQLMLSSELLLPELCPIDASIENPIAIVFGHARREKVTNPRVQGLYYHIQPEACWLEIPNITRFLIKQGRYIIVEPFPGVDEDSLRLFLYTICIPLVLIYHNFFLLHGGAIHWGEQAVAFLANFGQGKSTLLASFLTRDYLYSKRSDPTKASDLSAKSIFLSDDICVLNQDGVILPGLPHLQLREDSMKELGIEKNTLKRIRPTVQKWFVPVQQACYSQPDLLKTVYMINPTNRSDVQLTPLVGLKKVQYLKKYIYQPLLVKGLGKDLFYFYQCAALAARITATYVERAKHGFSWREFANVMEQDLQSKVPECL